MVCIRKTPRTPWAGIGAAAECRPKVSGIETLSEPVADLGEHRAGLIAVALPRLHERA
jgi:hypothetical protein